ncbi:hypothetical protein OH76DRAFT_748933 [Lentinus brumalis]|uniref:Uncharacterized protein n=1 Tax=Lentinus brumalis TaxID=2498619 RepID=A0A371DSM6_9APHY|nr:hypothetical protein OH76DRAFT_748933 [Polyporus brumalis]
MTPRQISPSVAAWTLGRSIAASHPSLVQPPEEILGWRRVAPDLVPPSPSYAILTVLFDGPCSRCFPGFFCCCHGIFIGHWSFGPCMVASHPLITRPPFALLREPGIFAFTFTFAVHRVPAIFLRGSPVPYPPPHPHPR